ncbi:hypothetical protein THC_0522 [Caldimicrobium thiodismutans]|uniref:Holliday junction branch migration complex subunit RuvA n=1 Tax=Caldimicrobium thiodismutans TaxID=1653476 RepID=A0A0U5ALL1_9BACT|nr:Holliday junction branch migration protein RuvA [Caldimicrobium thiodismutans]BAU22916.1 hypothetical protein THC_0522 [Caldimicrobium thiodismutans]
MFYKIRGIVKEVFSPNRLILESAVFFWEIYMPFSLAEILRQNFLGKEIEVFVVLLLRKNEYPELYGFLNQEERELFIKLNNLSKVGPKLALNLLSVFSPEELRKVIEERRIKDLARVPGIGEKRAERLFLELKGLFGKITRKGFTIPLEKERILLEAKACLVNLGFQSKEVEETLFRVFEEEDTLENLIKKALKELAPAFQEERP